MTGGVLDVFGRRRRMRRHPAPTFVFADLAGYTAMTGERGDQAAAELAREFRRAMCRLARDHAASEVKSMGDGVMIWASDAAQAITLAALAVQTVGSRPDMLPVRVGVHTGPAVMRGCDWYGSAVNVAARLASAAEPNEALIRDATHAAAAGPLDVVLNSPRELSLKGVGGSVAAWRIA